MSSLIQVPILPVDGLYASEEKLWVVARSTSCSASWQVWRPLGLLIHHMGKTSDEQPQANDESMIAEARVKQNIIMLKGILISKWKLKVPSRLALLIYARLLSSILLLHSLFSCCITVLLEMLVSCGSSSCITFFQYMTSKKMLNFIVANAYIYNEIKLWVLHLSESF